MKEVMSRQRAHWSASPYYYISYIILLPAVLSVVIQRPPNATPLFASLSTSPSLHIPTNFSYVEIAPNSPEPWPLALEGSPHNLSFSPVTNLTALPRPNVRYACDNDRNSLDPSDCRQVWQNLPKFDITYNFRNRSSPKLFDIPLPYRWISRKCLAFRFWKAVQMAELGQSVGNVRLSLIKQHQAFPGVRARKATR